MTREEAFNRIDSIIARHEIDDDYVTITSLLDYDALRLARKVLEQEPCEREYNDIYDHYLCGNCKTVVMDYDNYCPNCGAKLIEPQERSGKE